MLPFRVRRMFGIRREFVHYRAASQPCKRPKTAIYHHTLKIILISLFVDNLHAGLSSVIWQWNFRVIMENESFFWPTCEAQDSLLQTCTLRMMRLATKSLAETRVVLRIKRKQSSIGVRRTTTKRLSLIWPKVWTQIPRLTPDIGCISCTSSCACVSEPVSWCDSVGSTARSELLALVVEKLFVRTVYYGSTTTQWPQLRHSADYATPVV